MADIRKETDSLGEVDVAADKLWGVQTQRSLEHFSIGKDLIPREMITSYAIRNATVRKLAVQDLTTTVLTLTITGLAADSSLAGVGNPRWQTHRSCREHVRGSRLGRFVTEAFSVACALAVCGGFVHLRACTVFLSSQGSAGASRDTDKVGCVRIQAVRI
jgi:hypothetical protein